MKALENCRWVPRWVSHMGCLKGCLNFLGIDISDPWLYGGTGHAFVINLHEEVCPSGPTAWDCGKLFELGSNLGYRVGGVFGRKDQDDLTQLQIRAFKHVQQAIDQGYPCYGWELEIPEFYVVYGYERSTGDSETSHDIQGGYYYAGPGCEEGKGPKAWQELGDTGIGVLEVYSVAPGEIADDATTVKAALSFALEHAATPKESIYASGLKGYDNWTAALRKGRAGDMGMRYNTAVWLECRLNAAGFVEEAKARLPGRADAAFDDARSAYQAVAENLSHVAALYPWSSEAVAEDLLPVGETSEAAVAALEAAKEAEACGLQALEEIARAL